MTIAPAATPPKKGMFQEWWKNLCMPILANLMEKSVSFKKFGVLYTIINRKWERG